MAVVYTPDGGFAKPDLYSDQKETYYGDAFDQINRMVAGYLAVASGDVNYTLQDIAGARESRTVALKLTSTLTAARIISIDTTTAGKYRNRFFIIWNATGGVFKVTIKTTAGGSTGIDISNGYARMLWHDGTNVYACGAEVVPTTGLLGGAKARVYNSANISIANSTSVALTFDSERRDDGALHSTSSNTDRLVVPFTGWGLAWGNVAYDANATGFRYITIRLNGASTIIGSDLRQANSASETHVNISSLYYFTAGDYILLYSYQNSGGSLNIMGGAAGAQCSPEFGLAML